jgi:hypothetical protein
MAVGREGPSRGCSDSEGEHGDGQHHEEKDREEHAILRVFREERAECRHSKTDAQD